MIIEQIVFVGVLLVYFCIKVEFVGGEVVCFEDFIYYQCVFFDVVWELVGILVQLWIVVVGVNGVEQFQCNGCCNFMME